MQVQENIPVGSVLMFASLTIPHGYLYCNGESLLRTEYAELFKAIGTGYGAADGTHFSLPDFRGVFPKGHGATDRVAGVDASGNPYTGVLGTYEQDKLQGHIHIPLPGGTSFAVNVIAGQAGVGGGISSRTDPTTGVPSDDATNGVPRTGHTTEPQSLGIKFIIKFAKTIDFQMGP